MESIASLGAWVAEHPEMALSIVLLLASLGCRLFTSVTPTPAPGTRLAAIYSWIEMIGGSFGYAKDHGLITPTPELAAIASQAHELGRDIVSTINSSPTAPPAPQVVVDFETLAKTIASAMREAPPPAAAIEPVPLPAAAGTATAAAIALMLGVGMLGGLTGCGGTNPTPTTTPSISQPQVSLWLANLQAVNSQVELLEPAIAAIPGVDQGKLASAETALGDAGAAIAVLSAASSAADGQAALVKFELALNALVDVGAGLPLPPQVSAGFVAAAVALPLIETAVNLAATQLSPAVQALKAGAAQ